jgi:hypothetical protein
MNNSNKEKRCKLNKIQMKKNLNKNSFQNKYKEKGPYELSMKG